MSTRGNLLCQTPENVDEVLTAISKYQYHPSIKTLLENCNFSFSFKTVSLTDIQKEMNSLDTNKASNASDVPANILKQKVDFFMFGSVNKSTCSSTFPSILKFQYIKKIVVMRKVTTGLLVSYLTCLKSLYCMTKSPLFLKLFSPNIKLVSGKASIRKAV